MTFCVIDHRLLSIALILKYISIRFITALHAMQTRSSDENFVCLSVCPSVCPSVCHTRGLLQNGRKICPDFYAIRKNI